MTHRYAVPLISTNIGPHASAFAIVRADNDVEAAARAVRCADAWASDERKKTSGNDVHRDGSEVVGAPSPTWRPDEVVGIGSREFRAVCALQMHPDRATEEMVAIFGKQLPARFGLLNLGMVHEDK